ncbi:MAG: hypothetical protein HYT16_04550 [DPANN group archaeon]|nr:hypothetical protein [DPANN group archaeon]
MVEKPPYWHERPTTSLLYSALLSICIAIFIGFSYLGFLAFSITKNTIFFLLSYIVLAPVFVAGFLFLLLLIVGKTGFYRELAELHRYKVEV